MLLMSTPTRITAIDPAVRRDRPPRRDSNRRPVRRGLDGSGCTFRRMSSVWRCSCWWGGGATGRAGDTVRPLATSLAVATSMPFLLKPLDASWIQPLLVLGAVLLVGALGPLALALLARIDDERDRRFAGFAAFGCAMGALVLGVVSASSVPGYGDDLTLWVLLVAIPLIPGLAAAGPMRRRGTRRHRRPAGGCSHRPNTRWSAPRRPSRSHPTARRSRSP